MKGLPLYACFAFSSIASNTNSFNLYMQIPVFDLSKSDYKDTKRIADCRISVQ